MADVKRRPFPERGQGSNDSSKIGMEHAVIPAARVDRVVRIFANDILQSLQDAERARLRILRHEQDVTGSFSSHLISEFSKAAGIGEIERGVGFAAMAVAARNDYLIACLGEVEHRLVLLPAANAAQFESVDELAMLAEEQTQIPVVQFRALVRQIPHRMIQYYEDLRNIVERGENLRQTEVVGIARVLGECRHDRFCAATGKVMNAQVKSCVVKRNRPFY